MEFVLDLSERLAKETQEGHSSLRKNVIFLYLQAVYGKFLHIVNKIEFGVNMQKAGNYLKDLFTNNEEPDIKFAVEIVKECVEYRLMEENWELKQNKLMKAVVEKMDSMHRKLISNLNVWIKEKISAFEVVKFISSNDLNELPKELEKMLRNVGGRTLISLCETGDSEDFDVLFKQPHFCSLYSELVTKFHSELHSVEIALTTELANICIPAVEEMGKNPTSRKKFSDTAAEIILRVVEKRESVFRNLTQGTVEVSYFHVLEKRAEVLKLFRLKPEKEKEFIERLIQTRVDEISFFNQFLSDLRGFCQMLKDTELVDTKKMEALIENHKAISAKKLSEIVVPISLNSIRLNRSHQPQLNYSYLGETLMNLIGLQPTVEKCQQSSSFCKLKRGTADLKIFVDLAVLSTGDSPMEREKVHSFHTASLGFASLIFIPKEIQFSQLIKRLKDLEENFEGDLNLNEKLRDSRRNLEWLKSVSKKQGSSEETSMKMASAILKQGVLTVMKPAIHTTDFKSHDLVSIKIPGVEHKKKRGWKTLLFSEILELQSRLILVGGSADEERYLVEQFLELIENLQRLGDVFLDVLHLGCHFFENVTLEFSNNPDKVCCFTKKGTKLVAFTQHEMKHDCMTDCIVKVTRVFEKCYKSWTMFIEDERSRIYILNFFTTKQIVQLQSELFKVSKSLKAVQHILLPLISLINEDCNIKMIKEVIFADKEIVTGE
ncbi:uncharacterized protein LOC144625716 [Crassostrea virginica]